VYHNRNTGQTHTIDPRLSLFRTELPENGVQKIYVREPEIDAQSKDEGSAIQMLVSAFKPESEVCRLMGIDIRPFDLVKERILVTIWNSRLPNVNRIYTYTFRNAKFKPDILMF
jgi:hypothetical protein